MTNILVEWRLAGWAENILVVLLGLAIASLSVWLVIVSLKDVLERAARLEKMKSKKTDKALDEWMEAYREEHRLRIAAEQRAEQERSMRRQIAKGEAHEA